MKWNIAHGSVALALALTLLPSPAAAEDNAPESTQTIAPANAATPEKVAITPNIERAHSFMALAGSWSGGGTILLSGGIRERLRCRGRHTVGQGGNSLALNIRCASDSYRFDLSSDVVYRRGRISGRWSEASNNVSGTIIGHAVGNRIQAVATGDSFSAGLSLTTNGNQQSVSITPKGVYITGVHIALSKR